MIHMIIRKLQHTSRLPYAQWSRTCNRFQVYTRSHAIAIDYYWRLQPIAGLRTLGLILIFPFLFYSGLSGKPVKHRSVEVFSLDTSVSTTYAITISTYSKRHNNKNLLLRFAEKSCWPYIWPSFKQSLIHFLCVEMLYTFVFFVLLKGKLLKITLSKTALLNLNVSLIYFLNLLVFDKFDFIYPLTWTSAENILYTGFWHAWFQLSHSQPPLLTSDKTRDSCDLFGCGSRKDRCSPSKAFGLAINTRCFPATDSKTSQ